MGNWQEGQRLKKQVNTFLADLEDYLKSEVETPYYFGHFLYEQKDENVYAIIDGQQRLTTIIIFLCALFNRLKELRDLSEDECDLYEDMIKRRSTYKFSTVHYDNQLFRDYVIDTVKKDHYGIETSSGKRIVAAYDYFVEKLSSMKLDKIEALLNAVTLSSCTTHIVKSEAEAIQMFIFQNYRGKSPSHLEVIKALFMYNIHIYGDAIEIDVLIEQVKARFENIYRHISDIEDFVDEDAVLTHTLRVYFNSLWESNATERINSELGQPSCIDFILNFTLALERSFNNLSRLCNGEIKNRKDFDRIFELFCASLESPQ